MKKDSVGGMLLFAIGIGAFSWPIVYAIIQGVQWVYEENPFALLVGGSMLVGWALMLIYDFLSE